MPSALINNLVEQHGLPLLLESTLDDFTAAHEHSVLFFTENPKQFPESNDVAVILPELLRQFDGRLRAAVIARSDERRLSARFPFDGWPALVFLRRGKYLGAITRVQDWTVYLAEIERLLRAEPLPPPRITIPVVSEASEGCR